MQLNVRGIPIRGTRFPIVLRVFVREFLGQFRYRKSTFQFAVVHLVLVINEVHCEVSGRFLIHVVGSKIAAKPLP